MSLDFGADGKIAKKVQDVIKAANPTVSVFIVSPDDEGEK